jgi:hypothetical protein
MNTLKKRFLSIAMLSAILVTAGVAASAKGSNRLEFPGDFPGPPFYARLQAVPLEADGWVAIPFYREPAQVPAGFNLLLLFDIPGAFFVPLTTEGFVVQDESGALVKAVTRGLPGMPVWFVSSVEFASAAGDGVVTITDLLAMASLRRGNADSYREELHPGEQGRPAMIEIVSHGAVGGQEFTMQFVETGGSGPRGRIRFR